MRSGEASWPNVYPFRCPSCDSAVLPGMRAAILSFRNTHQASFISLKQSPVQSLQLPIGRLSCPRRHVALNHQRRALSPQHVRSYRLGIVNRDEPTIYALSTAAGKAAIAVIRVSGPACRLVRLLHQCRVVNISDTAGRYMKASVLQRPFPSLDMLLSASYLLPMWLPRPPRSSTLALWCYTFPLRTP